MSYNIIKEQVIFDTLEKHKNFDPVLIQEILNKALELKGLSVPDVATLIALEDPKLLKELFRVAKQVKEAIYGNRLVIFAPLYISNQCTNNCLYCAFRTGNKALKRCTLSQEEIAEETERLIKQGHKRLLLLAGETHTQDSFQYILDAITTIYSSKDTTTGRICRINN